MAELVGTDEAIPEITEETISNQARQEEYYRRWRVPWKSVQDAIDQGYIYPGWKLKDYLQASFHGNPALPASPVDGKLRKPLEYVNVWGQPGSGKSAFVLQLFGLLYQDWDVAINRMVLSREMLNMVYSEVAGPRQRIPALCLDDLNVIIPKQLWQQDKDYYILFQQFLNTIRTKAGTLVTTLPNISFTMEMLGEMTTLEVMMFPNSRYKVSRYCWDTHPYKPLTAKFTKIVVEYSQFDVNRTPRDVWDRYEDKRRETANEIFQKLAEYQREKLGAEKEVEMKQALVRALKMNPRPIFDQLRAEGWHFNQPVGEELWKRFKEAVVKKAMTTTTAIEPETHSENG